MHACMYTRTRTRTHITCIPKIKVAARIRAILHDSAISHLTRLTVTSLIPLEAADLQAHILSS